jgi:type VI secretion system protein ImpC
MRDKIGSFMGRGEVEQYLNQWIDQYVAVDDDISPELKAQFPLRGAKVEVSEVEGNPGAYTAIVYLSPRFLLDEPAASLRLVVDLPAPAK